MTAGLARQVGTSTGLRVEGLTRKLDLAPFGPFEIATLGLAVAVAGGLLLALAAPRLLPDRGTAADALTRHEAKSWLADLFILEGSPLVGAATAEAAALSRAGGRVVDAARGDLSLRRSAVGYRFTYFLRLGVPVNIVVDCATVPLIPLLWPL